MAQSIRYVALAALLVAAAATHAQNEGAIVDIQKEALALMQADRDFSALSVEKGMAAAFDTYMTDSAVMYRNQSLPIVGRAAINARLAGAAGVRLEWEPTFADLAASGDLGYTLGTWTMTVTPAEGEPQVAHGHYVTIWRKQPDGSWKWTFDTGTQNPEDK